MSEIRRPYETPTVEQEGIHEADVEYYQYGDFQIAQIILQGERSVQQDRDVIIPFGKDGFASIICDGHGMRGDAAAELVASGILDYLEDIPSGDSVDQKVFQAVVDAMDVRVQQKFPDAGTTLICTYRDVKNGIFRIGTVGDSEARVIRTNGNVERITWPHNFSHTAELYRLTHGSETDMQSSERVLRSRDGRSQLAVTRAVGDRDFPEAISRVEWKSYDMQEGETLILASDGLWERIDGNSKRKRRLRDIALEHSDAKDIMNIFLKECVTDGWIFHDNTSMHIVTNHV
jgi:serine/threonine protein phosphatase PrpC